MNKSQKCLFLCATGVFSSLWMRREHHSAQPSVSFGFSPTVPNKNISELARNIHCQIKFVKSLIIVQVILFPREKWLSRIKISIFKLRSSSPQKIFYSKQDLRGQVVATQLLTEDGKSEGHFHRIKTFIRSQNIPIKYYFHCLKFYLIIT